MSPSPLSHKEILRHAGFIGLILLIGTAIYSNSFAVPFYFDDYFTIVENFSIRELKNIPQIWQFDPSRFLTYLSFAVNFDLGELRVTGYHLVNLIFHLAATMSVYFFILQTAQLAISRSASSRLKSGIHWIGISAALIFLCHPIQTQAVTYISQRSSVLACLFYMLTFNFYILFRRKGGRRYYLIALGVYLVGIFTKPNIITLPLAVLFYEIYFFKDFARDIRKILKYLLPFCLLASAVPMLLSLWRYEGIEISQVLEMTRETAKLSRQEYFFTQFNVAMTYLRLLIFPAGLSLDYDFPIVNTLFSFPTWLSLGVLAALVMAAIRLFPGYRLISFGMVWMAVTLSLESSIFPIDDVINEHRLYLPLVGFGLIVSSALAEWGQSNKLRLVVIVVCLLTLCGLTYQRNEQWLDRRKFHEDMVDRFPNKSRLRSNLGVIYSLDRDFDLAIEQFQKAIALQEDNYRAYFGLADSYLSQERYGQVLDLAQKSVEINPNFFMGYHLLGNFYRKSPKPNYQLARNHYLKAIRLQSSYAPSIVGLGIVYLEEGDATKARFYFLDAVRRDPSYAYSYAQLGDLYVRARRYDSALFYYQEALKRNSMLALVHNNLGNIYQQKGLLEKAVFEYKETIVLNPQYSGAYFNLANVLKMQGHVEEARFYLNKARKLSTGSVD